MSDYFTEDLLLLILKRLPVKTLLRFQCVSKSWKNLITSKPFIQDHLAFQTRRIVVQNGDLRYLLLDSHTLPSFEFLERPIWDTSDDRTRHGFSFSSVHGVNCVYNNANILLLFNPSTRQRLHLPLPESSIFDSIVYFKYCGFWIDPSSIDFDFKVVIFCLETQYAVLFSSKELRWVEIDMGEVGEELRADSQSRPQVMIDGVAHWTAFHEDERHIGDVVSFDFEQQKFRLVEFAPVVNTSTIYLYLCKWKDLLSVVHWDFMLQNVCELWVMNNGSWSKMLRFELPQDILWVYCVLESSGRVLAADEEDSIVLYDPDDGIFALNTESRIFGVSFSYDFVESLIFPCGDYICWD